KPIVQPTCGVDRIFSAVINENLVGYGGAPADPVHEGARHGCLQSLEFMPNNLRRQPPLPCVGRHRKAFPAVLGVTERRIYWTRGPGLSRIGGRVTRRVTRGCDR